MFNETNPRSEARKPKGTAKQETRKLRNGAAVIVLCAIGGLLAGCGNVSLTGEALTAAEQSTLDAYQAVQRISPCAACVDPAAPAAATQPCAPAWARAYLEENFKQWRFFVRSARKDLNWGPKLAGE